MRILIPLRDIKRYKRNTEIYEEYRQMLTENKNTSANQIFTRLAANYNLSVAMVRKVIALYTRDYPLTEANSNKYLRDI